MRVGKHALKVNLYITSHRNASLCFVSNREHIKGEKAQAKATRPGIDNFYASNGWIDCFKQSHNHVYKAICGESSSVDPATVEKRTDAE